MGLWRPWMSAAFGLAAGAGLVVLLPVNLLFIDTSAYRKELESGGGERWACPMMCFIGAKEGTCPVCGMTMTKVTAGELSAEQSRRIGLQTTTVQSGPAVATVRGYGVANYDHRFTRLVVPRVAGRIVQRYEATEGCCEVVDAGAPIIELYSPEVIAAQGELQAAVRLGDAALLESLHERFVRWNLDDVARSVMDGGPIRETVTIHSPFAGQVLLEEFEMVNSELAIGREIMADMPLLRLVDPDRLVLVVHVPETQARWITEGQPVLVESDDSGTLPQVKAVVARVAAEINTATRSREVRIYLEGARNLLMPGSLVSARIQAALAPDLSPADWTDQSTWGQFVLVPKTAVLSTGVRHVAWKVTERSRDGSIRFEPAPLALGPRLEDENGNDLYVVRAGLAAGDEVATQGAFLIDSQAQLAGTPSLLYPLGATAPAADHQH